MFDRSKRGEHALLIQPHAGKLEEDVLEEFVDLARSAGASIAAELSAHASVLLLEAEDRPGYHATGRSAAFFQPASASLPETMPEKMADWV